MTTSVTRPNGTARRKTRRRPMPGPKAAMTAPPSGGVAGTAPEPEVCGGSCSVTSAGSSCAGAQPTIRFSKQVEWGIEV